jgi:hypothetical protein
MEWLNEIWVQIPAAVILVTAASAAAYKTMPTVWAAMKAAVRLGEIHRLVVKSEPILEDLIAQFDTNGGSSLSQQMTNLEAHAANERRERQAIGEDVGEIRSMVSAFIEHRQPGGKRSTD